MKKKKNIQPDIFDKIRSKDQNDLSKEEKLQLSEFISGSEYSDIKKTIMASEEHFTENEVDPGYNLEEKLLAGLDSNDLQHDHKDNFIAKIFSYRLPIYQAAAVIIILFFSWTLLSNGSNPMIKYITKIKTVKDTVYVDQIIKSENVIKEASHKRKRLPKIELKLSGHPDKRTTSPAIVANYYENQVKRTIKMVSKKRSGSSASDDSLLTGFLRSVH